MPSKKKTTTKKKTGKDVGYTFNKDGKLISVTIYDVKGPDTPAYKRMLKVNMRANEKRQKMKKKK